MAEGRQGRLAEMQECPWERGQPLCSSGWLNANVVFGSFSLGAHELSSLQNCLSLGQWIVLSLTFTGWAMHEMHTWRIFPYLCKNGGEAVVYYVRKCPGFNCCKEIYSGIQNQENAYLQLSSYDFLSLLTKCIMQWHSVCPLGIIAPPPPMVTSPAFLLFSVHGVLLVLSEASGAFSPWCSFSPLLLLLQGEATVPRHG